MKISQALGTNRHTQLSHENCKIFSFCSDVQCLCKSWAFLLNMQWCDCCVDAHTCLQDNYNTKCTLWEQ